jgi:hypothetical protein
MVILLPDRLIVAEIGVWLEVGGGPGNSTVEERNSAGIGFNLFAAFVPVDFCQASWA